eukprot:m.920414 g.920414  ORF g.920414 m.920414 type:complete len:70 (+) comp64685_c0_seq1:244-453(+)
MPLRPPPAQLMPALLPSLTLPLRPLRSNRFVPTERAVAAQAAAAFFFFATLWLGLQPRLQNFARCDFAA